MLLFELFPAIFAVVALIIGVMLFATNRRARNDPDQNDPPRTPSCPPVSPDAMDAPSANVRRPSMRA